MKSTISPTHRTYTGPKDFFLHLLAIVTMYVTVVSFIALLFQYIQYIYPDITKDYYTVSAGLDSIRWYVSLIFVMFPVYLLTSWLIQRDIAAEPMKAEFKVRKWLIYLTLFVAALTIIIDLVTLMYYFLDGDITVRFILKILVVLITAATVFGYHIWDLRRTDYSVSRQQKLFAIIVSVVVLASIIGGFFIVGSPGQQRKVRMDETRVQQLNNIHYELINHWQRTRTLPETLAVLQNNTGVYTLSDPETGEPYEYKRVSDTSYEICATFATESRGNERGLIRDPYSAGQNWTHEAGRTCFARAINPELYPPLEGVQVKPVPGVR